MKRFNKDKELIKLRVKQNKNTYIKRIGIIFSCVILLVLVMYFAFAKFESNQEYTLINGVVKLVTSYKVRGNANSLLSEFSSYNLNTNDIDMGQDKAKTCTNTLAYDRTNDNNLRYVGANPCNYVSYNGELWRIIGVMNNTQTEGGQSKSLIKIIRADSLGNYSWDTSASSVNSGMGINQWGESGTYEGADLMRELNTDYLGTVTVGTNGKWYSERNNDKSSNKPSSSLSNTSQNLIESIVWRTGAGNANMQDTPTWTSLNLYTNERGNYSGKQCSSNNHCDDPVSRTYTKTAKVGLVYPSDYGYATSGGSTTSRTTCLNTTLGSWDGSSISDCKNNDWLLDTTNYQWTLTSNSKSDKAVDVYIINKTGNITTSMAYLTRIIRPVVYLKSTVSITGGEGSQTKPYTLE